MKFSSAEMDFQLLEELPDAMIMVNREGMMIYANTQAQNLFGYEQKELLGKPIEVLVPSRYRSRHLKQREDFSAAPRRRPMGTGLDLWGLRKDGSEFPVEISLSPIQTREGPLIFAAIRDITERKQKQEELERSQAQLKIINQDLMAFSYSVSHDLQAPLRHMEGFASLLEKHLAPALDEKGREYLRIIQNAASQMSQLIKDLLSFSRMARVDMMVENVDLEDLARQVKEELAHEAKDRKIIWKIDPLPRVRGDIKMLRLALMNLMENSVKYTRPREEARIEVGSQDREGEEVVIFVKDNGVGFDMKYADKLFGVFQRLHREDEFEGTGIGLANVRRIIQRHGGRTWAKGEEGTGATFYFSLKKSN